MSRQCDDEKIVHRYFVDEAGDTTLFAKGGKVLVGTEGCSKTFMLGLARIADTARIAREIEGLRSQLLSDPYFKDVPSMQPNANKTAICFHAKNDLPEVRREVLRLIATFDITVLVAIRRKSFLADIGLQARRLGGHAMIGPDQIYDDLVKRLFTRQLHLADHNKIIFAKRGKSARIESLAAAISKAKAAFAKYHRRKAADKPTDIFAMLPSETCGLQVIDYYLWALQRMYERGKTGSFKCCRTDIP